MALNPHQTLEFVVPTEEEATLAQASSQALASYIENLQTGHTIKVVVDEGTSKTIKIPASALHLLVDILTQMAKGNAVTLIPVKKELTTQESADILNVSRPYLVDLLESGKIPFRKVGTRRRVRYQDVIDYKNQIDAQRMQILKELAAQAQELNMEYE
ncbi:MULTISPECIES: helix-turn-helix domain-containing protein [unclassified Anabaena]|uniref:helix-turn-helix domain-containing protein n=1 Tax=unclassified Anabaena TaxID=2619674 RepID=UPI0039C76198